MSAPTSAPAAPPAPARKKKRGRETPGDMVRSLGLVFLIVLPIWYLAQPPGSDEQAIRVVDPSGDVRAFAQVAPGVPVPTDVPVDWRATSSTLEPGSLRIGWVTPSGQYAEYDGLTGAQPDLAAVVGEGTTDGPDVVVGTVTWRSVTDADGHTSLVRQVAGGTVVVGSLRETASDEELRVLAASLSGAAPGIAVGEPDPTR